jgi:hypothetical protein
LPLLACADTGGSSRSLVPEEEWSLTEELRIGAMDVADQNLTRVLGALPTPDGGIWILQSDDNQVRVYSGAGQFVRTVGQRGRAPGEFQLPNAIGWWGGGRDTIWVRDQQRRITVFTADGTYARTIGWNLIPYLSEWTMNRPDVMLPDGSAVGLAVKNAPAERLDSRLIRVDLVSGTVQKEIARLRRVEMVRQTGNTTLRLPIPYHELVAYAPDGTWIAVVDRAAPGMPEVGELPVHAISVEGDTLWSRTFNYQPIPIPQTLIDSILDERTENRRQTMIRTGGNLADVREWVESRYTFPGHRPPIQTALIGQDGRLWLEWTDPADGPGEWWALSSEGVPAGRIRPTQRIRPLAAGDEVVWALEMNELDVPFVVRYRIAPDRSR